MGAFIGLPGAILRGLAAFLTAPAHTHKWGWTFGRCVQPLKGAPAGADTSLRPVPRFFELENEHDARYSAT
jgi:hypothetical protein